MSEHLRTIQPGDRAGPFRILRRFKGRGGMAAVFEAEVREKYRAPYLPRRLALKVAMPEHQAALTAEANFLSRFDHPNVVRIFPLPRGEHRRPVYAAREQFSFGWGWYYVMELLGDESLEHRLTRPATVTHPLQPPEGERRLSLLEALGIARQLAAALEHIHERYVINLDVKPGNILFRRRRFRFLRGSVPQAVLCDFGISRDLRYPRTGLLGVATPAYVSPEQTSEISQYHRPVDARSDIFSMGIVLYEMLTGVLPFETVALAADPNYVPPSPRQLRPSIPPQLDEIVMRALAKDPTRRFQTAAEMRSALEQVPTPPDWGAAARRTFAVVTLAACIAAGSWGVKSYVETREATPVPTPPPTVEPATFTPTTTPATPTLTVSPTTEQQDTSTPAPTLTPTNTPRPVTRTPTPAEGG